MRYTSNETFKIGLSQDDLYALRLCYFKYQKHFQHSDRNGSIKKLFQQYCMVTNKSRKMVPHTLHDLEELLLILGDIIFHEENKALQKVYYRLLKILQKRQTEQHTLYKMQK